jgi:hypothetical protein
MNFKTAFDKAFEIEEKRCKKLGIANFFINPSTAKILAYFWNMIVISKNKMEDLVHIDGKNNIIIVPLKTEKPVQSKKKTTKKSGQKKSKSKTADKGVLDDKQPTAKSSS